MEGGYERRLGYCITTNYSWLFNWQIWPGLTIANINSRESLAEILVTKPSHIIRENKYQRNSPPSKNVNISGSQGWGQVHFIKYKYKYKYFHFSFFILQVQVQVQVQ